MNVVKLNKCKEGRRRRRRKRKRRRRADEIKEDAEIEEMRKGQ